MSWAAIALVIPATFAIPQVWGNNKSVLLRGDLNSLDNWKPPATTRIAIMNDSDNSGESSVSWVDYLEIYR
jgi:hypothetical protein